MSANSLNYLSVPKKYILSFTGTFAETCRACIWSITPQKKLMEYFFFETSKYQFKK
jgi:hypothetical protein